MNIDPCYPVRNCHFCGQIIFYNRYESGEHYAYCNNTTHMSCMGFTYAKANEGISLKEFTISDMDILYFKVSASTSNEGEMIHTNTLLIRQGDAPPRRIDNLLDININTILNKDSCIKLLKNIHKTILLMD